MRTVTATVALALAALLGVARAQAGGCALTADPEPGWPGAHVGVTGSGFAAGADVTVYLGDYPVYDGFIGPDGTFRISFVIPDPFAIGEVGLVVVDHTDSCAVTMTYVILAEPPPEQEATIELWGLALLVGAGAALGVGIAGLAVRREQ